MHCSNCGQPVRPEVATHEVLIKGGKPIDVYLCEACAAKAAGAVKAHAPATQIVVAAIQQATGTSGEAAARQLTCPQCRTTFAQFRHDGVLGCPACYDAFEQPLSPLLERAHEGGTHHVGKVPRRASALRSGQPGPGVPARQAPVLSAQERAQRAMAMRKQLAEAIAAEQYERAARLRDELRRLETPGLEERA